MSMASCAPELSRVQINAVMTRWEGEERKWGRRTGKQQNRRALEQPGRLGGRGETCGEGAIPGTPEGPMWAGMWRRPARPPSAGQHLSFPHALYELLGSGRSKRGRYPGGPRRHLRSRHYRQLKRHMQLLFSGPGQLRARLPAAVPRDNKPLSRDSGRRWVAVARSLKGEGEWGACAVRSGAGPGSGEAGGR